MALIRQRTRPNCGEWEATTRTVGGWDADKRCDWRGHGTSTVISGLAVGFMAAAVAAVGTFDPLTAAGTPLLRGKDLQLWRGCCTWCGRIIRARTMIPKPFGAFHSLPKDASAPMDWIAGDAGQRRHVARLRRRHLPLHSGACDVQSDWTPPAVPALCDSGSQRAGQWAIGVTYSIGDEVTYGGTATAVFRTYRPSWMDAAARFRRCGRRYDDRPSGAGCNRHGCCVVGVERVRAW